MADGNQIGHSRYGLLFEQRHRIGVSQVMWESDYPHPDSAWPHSRKRLADGVVDIPDDEVRLMVETNARRLFGLGADSA